MKFLVLNGPNINLLGVREPEIYGKDSWADIEKTLAGEAERLGIEIEYFQSNHEGALIDKLHGAMKDCSGVILNAGAYTHTSLALADAIRATKLRVIEVHLSNPAAREDIRRTSLITPVCEGIISGFGGHSYLLALWALFGEG